MGREARSKCWTAAWWASCRRCAQEIIWRAEHIQMGVNKGSREGMAGTKMGAPCHFFL